ncbi:MAG: NCS2 family permease [bacterium]
MRRFLNYFFKLPEHGTNIRTELVAGLITFLTMSYIIFVQPAVLSGDMFGSPTGMDRDAVMVATCLAAALATVIMAVYANYPIALAPGMGENFFFVLSVIAAAGTLPIVKSGGAVAWQIALGVVFISGVLFFILYFLGIRERMLDAISPSLKNGIAVGIGLFIAFIGLQNAGLIVTAASIVPVTPPVLVSGTLVKLNTHFASPDLCVFFFGLLLTAILHTRRVRGSILWGILGATVLSISLKLILPHIPQLAAMPMVAESKLMTRFIIDTQIISMPPSVAPVFMKMDLVNAILPAMIPFIIMFLFMDVFDTIGTMIGVAEQAGFVKDNKLPRAGKVMLADQVGTIAGAMLGTSTTTSYIESCAGVEHGGRTGLTALTTAALFLLALFFSPLVGMIASYSAITAPALVLVGAMMVGNVLKVNWSDYSESVPAFLVMLGIPLCYSISDGIALGFIAYPVVKLFSGRAREASWLMYVMGVLLVLYFVFVRSAAG